jgi:hypothetical protein
MDSLPSLKTSLKSFELSEPIIFFLSVLKKGKENLLGFEPAISSIPA